MTKPLSLDTTRPYLVIPKLIEQPTWGGQYIVTAKGWHDRTDLTEIKIGQSYELFSGSNLSLLDSSADPEFIGELTDRDAVQIQTHPDHSLPLADLVNHSPQHVLGTEVVTERGPKLELLIKFTQALGNSFQVHIKTGTKHPRWKPKPESWYFFEPGLITLGVKPDANWDDYQEAVTSVDHQMQTLSDRVKAGDLSYAAAQPLIQALMKKYDPWQYVNELAVRKDELVDLSEGALHHSWEEDAKKAPLGNVLYELQTEAMDDISTFRSFDKGKMGKNGEVRELRIQEYFDHIDRHPEINDPLAHLQQPRPVANTPEYLLDRLLETAFYNLDKLTFLKAAVTLSQHPSRFKHLFVKAGKITVTSEDVSLTVTSGHSCFIPASVHAYEIKSLEKSTEVLISS